MVIDVSRKHSTSKFSTEDLLTLHPNSRSNNKIGNYRYQRDDSYKPIEAHEERKNSNELNVNVNGGGKFKFKFLTREEKDSISIEKNEKRIVNC